MKAVALARRSAKYAGYPVFFLLCFWISLVLTFPIERFVPVLEQQAGATLGREVSIGDVSLSLLGRLVFSSVTIGIPDEEQEPDVRTRSAALEFADDPAEEDDGDATA
ncbi:MAG TPA: hypothetical protein VM285_09765, partial [Polyangia bacterium]|nr:hypothetical protein [Polyangia bacterium]